MNIQIETQEEAAMLLRNVIKQYPFAAMKALNILIVKAQKVQRAHHKKTFTIRRPGWWFRTVKIRREDFAKKNRLTAILRLDPKEDRHGRKPWEVFVRQEIGGTRRPIFGHSALALPQEDVERTSSGIVKQKERPRRLKRDFVVKFASGAEGLFQRIGPRQKAFTTYSRLASGFAGRKIGLREDPNVKFMYYLAPKAEVDEALEFFDIGARVWNMHSQRVFKEEINKAFGDAAKYWRNKS